MTMKSSTNLWWFSSVLDVCPALLCSTSQGISLASLVVGSEGHTHFLQSLLEGFTALRQLL